MALALFCALIASLAACLWTWQQLRQRSHQLDALQERVAGLEAANTTNLGLVTAERARAETAMTAKHSVEQSLRAADDDRRSLYRRVTEAEADLAAARARLAEAAGRADVATAEVVRLRDEIAQRSETMQPSTLWTLELARSERTWRNSVSPGPHADPPFDTAEDPLRVAVEVEVAALREEVGADIWLDWRITEPLAPEASFSVLRGAQEVLAAAAKAVDGGALVVEAGDGIDEILLTLAPDDAETPEVIDLTIPVFAGTGIEPIPNGVRIRLPPAVKQAS